jgi:hypothetical protein
MVSTLLDPVRKWEVDVHFGTVMSEDNQEDV